MTATPASPPRPSIEDIVEENIEKGINSNFKARSHGATPGPIARYESPDPDSLFVSQGPGLDERKPTDSTWLNVFDGHLWPIVICDETSAPPKFLETKRHDNWMPAFMLGRRRYVWVIPGQLKEYVAENDYLCDQPSFNNDTNTRLQDDEYTNELRKRYKAFTQDAPEMRTAKQWYDHMKTEKLMASNRKLLGEEHKRAASKRKLCEERALMSRPNSTQLYCDTGPPKKRLDVKRNSVLLPRGHSLAVDPVQEDAALERLVRDKRPLKTTITRADGSIWTQAKFTKAPTDGYYDIFTGGPVSLQFRTTALAMESCNILADAVEYTKDTGSFVNLAKANIHFSGRGEYVIDILECLETGDFIPRTIQSMPDIENNQCKRDRAAEHIAWIFHDAEQFRDINIPQDSDQCKVARLQNLCLTKMKKLRAGPASTLKCGTTLLSTSWKQKGSNLENRIRNWFAGYIAGEDWSLTAECGSELANAMQSDRELRMTVWQQCLKERMGFQRGMKNEWMPL